MKTRRLSFTQSNARRAAALSLFAAITISPAFYAAGNGAPAKTEKADGTQLQRLIDVLDARALDPAEQADFQRVIAGCSDKISVHYALAMLYQRSGLMESAYNEYDLATSAGTNPSTFARLSQTTRNNWYDSMFALVNMKLRLNDPTKLPELISSFTRNCNEAPRLLRLAKLLSSAGPSQKASAETVYTALLHLPRSNQSPPDLLIAQSAAALELDKYAQAETLAKTLSASPDMNVRMEAERIVASAQFLQGRYQQAAESLQKVVNNKPDDVVANERLAFSLVQSGASKASLVPLMRVLSHKIFDSPNKETKDHLAALVRALPKPSIQAAIERVCSESSDDRTRGGLMLAMGAVYDQANQPLNAINCYKQGLHFLPTYGRGYLRLGQDIERCFGDETQAHGLYKAAFTLAPDDNEIKAAFTRSEACMANSKNNLAARLKTMLKSANQESSATR